jgi:tetrahydromethanopterin S-methyltransferase subunit B
VFQIAFLMRFLRESWNEMAPLDDDLAKIEAIACDLAQRLQGQVDAQIHVMASSLASAATGARSGANVAAHMDEMDRLATALLHALSPSQCPTALTDDVAAAVANAKSRGRRG